eukprot:s571_g26.t1
MSSEEKPWCRTKYGCGHYSIKGPWVYCDERGVERRRADDGKLYNALQFKKFFDKEGRDKWTNAAKYTETRTARNGKAYTAAEFRDYYIDYLGEEGWVKEWSSSKEDISMMRAERPRTAHSTPSMSLCSIMARTRHGTCGTLPASCAQSFETRTSF